MKERSFYSNLFFSLGLNLLVKPAAIFIIDAAVQNRVGDAYGIYFAFFNLSLILSILFDLGINNLNIKLAAQECGFGNELTRAPRLPLVGEERERVLRIIREGIKNRPRLTANV